MSSAIYIASDLHLGVPGATSSLERERRFVRWLELAAQDATEIWLLGDVFDFWFEYRSVVPRGHTRLLGALARITDAGIPVHFYAGNHDLWTTDYFQSELSIPVHRTPQTRQWHGRTYYLAHGDGIGPGDHGYKLMKRIISNPVVVWAFRLVHPSLAFRLARSFSKTSRKANQKNSKRDYGTGDWLYRFSDTHSRETGCAVQGYIFGHRHLPRVHRLPAGADLLMLGDWLTDYSYIRIDAEGHQLLSFEDKTLG